jgi:hypothetical protein
MSARGEQSSENIPSELDRLVSSKFPSDVSLTSEDTADEIYPMVLAMPIFTCLRNYFRN